MFNLPYFALGGALGPAFFTVVVLICSSLRPDYNHIALFISELGATGTTNDRLMNFAGFIPTGIFLISFGMSLILWLPKSFSSRIGSTLIIIFGIGVIIAGIFSCDPGCPRTGSLENQIHDKVSGLIFLMAIIGILLVGISFDNLPPFKRAWANYSFLTVILSMVFLVALANSIESYTFTGLWQRLLLTTIFLWCSLVGIRLFRYKSLNVKMGQ